MTRLMVAQAGCLRRGRRAGLRVQLRRWRVAASKTDTRAEIPVVTTRRHLVPDTYRALKPSPSQRKSVLTEIAVDQSEPFIPCMFMADIRGGFTARADELAAVLHENGVDIACVTETFLNNSVPSEVLDIPGYVIHHSNQKDGRRCVMTFHVSDSSRSNLPTSRHCGCCTDGPGCLDACPTSSSALYTTHHQPMIGR